MTTKCDFCARELLDQSIVVLTIHLAELTTEKTLGEDLELNACYDCVPTILINLKKGIKQAELLALSDVVWRYDKRYE